MYQNQKEKCMEAGSQRAQLLKQYREQNAVCEKMQLPLVSKEIPGIVTASREQNEVSSLQKRTNTGSLLKYRMIIAGVLFIAAWIYVGKSNETDNQKQVQIRQMIENDMDLNLVTNVFDFMDGFTYTLHGTL